MPCYQIDGLTPIVHPQSFIHPSADIIGDVIIGKNVYVGPQASIRGDFGRILIRDGSNIQDGCVIHGFPNHDTVLEEDSHIGHGAVIHGCHIRRNCLVGMNSVVMDLSEIGEESIIGAHSFIKAKSRFEPRSMILGSPAKFARRVTDDELEWKNRGTAMYHQLVGRCIEGLKPVEPLTDIESNRPVMTFDRLHRPKS